MRFLMEQILGPTLRRLGTFIGGYLVSVGMAADLATQIEAAVIALALFAVDLLNSYNDRRR